MHHYDPTFSPPAPCINLIVHHPSDPTKAVPGRRKLDTGADLCVIPQRLVTELQLLLVDEIAARAYDGTLFTRPMYIVSIEVAGHWINNVPAIAVQRKDVLLGRNVLNHLTITLKGKDLIFELRDP